MIQDKVREGLDSVRGLRRDEILAALGLERKSSKVVSVLTAAGVFVAGVAIGASAALLAAPRTGRELRRNIMAKLTDATRRISVAARERRAPQQVSESSIARAEDDGMPSAGRENGTSQARKIAETAKAAFVPRA